jgi:hypothetical protein
VYSTQPLHVYFHESRGGNWEEGEGKWEWKGKGEGEVRKIGKERKVGGGRRERRNGRGVGREEWKGKGEGEV